MTSSPVRLALRQRLTKALRERDKPTAAAIRSAVAALENAEAVPTSQHPVTATSTHVAGAAIGVGAAEAERLALDEATESAILRAEVDSLIEAAREYESLGRGERAAEARAAADELSTVVHSVLGTTWG
ncbi:MAG TPA: hypothetical protein VFY98_07230 [Intrasporangium sp.]|nr:hypothetical protein [Intrasporangium sp.]